MVKHSTKILSSQRKKWQNILRFSVGKKSHGEPIVLDANVFISAIIFGGSPEKACLSAINMFNVCLSFELLDEVNNFMSRSTDASRKFVKLVEDSLSRIGTVYELTNIPAVVRDPKDNHLIALALMSEAEIIVSGDKDLLTLGTYKSIAIMSPTDFITLIS